MILAENLIFSKKNGFFRRLRPFLALGPISSQKMFFSGACGYVSSSEPLLLMPGYPEVPGYKLIARLRLKFPVARLVEKARLPG